MKPIVARGGCCSCLFSQRVAHCLPPPPAQAHVHTYYSPPKHTQTHTHCVNSCPRGTDLLRVLCPYQCLPLISSSPTPTGARISKHGTLRPQCLLYLLGKRPNQSLGRLKVCLGRHLGALRMASRLQRRVRGAWQGCHQMLQPLEPACQVLGVVVGGTWDVLGAVEGYL